MFHPLCWGTTQLEAKLEIDSLLLSSGGEKGIILTFYLDVQEIFCLGEITYRAFLCDRESESSPTCKNKNYSKNNEGRRVVNRELFFLGGETGPNHGTYWF
jgi:hypothetical protein